jgi:CubicO group peptidase (beta-lactamase class C family)
MIVLLALLVTLASPLGAVSPALAQTQSPSPDPQRLAAYFDAQIPAYLDEFRIPGAVVAVVQDGAPVHLAGYGFANLEQQIPMDATQSVVHIGSLGKTFTATAIMQLVEQGRLGLDDDVSQYLDFAIPPTYPQPITIRSLLNHTSGFEAHDIGAVLVGAQALPTSREYLVRNLPARVRPPGAAIGYSNYGLALLGYVVERITGMALSDYLDSSIVRPLGMAHTITQQTPPAEQLGNLAVGYEALTPQPLEYVAAYGAGPIRSTAADMVAYMLASLQLGHVGAAEILQPHTARAMQTRQASAALQLNGTGFGFYEMSRNGQHIFGHLGSTTYFHSLLLLFPEQQLGIFVAFNAAEGARVLRTPRFMDDLTGTFFPQTSTAVAPPADFPARAPEYAGTYFWNNLHGQTSLEKLLFLTDAVSIHPTEDNRLRLASGATGQVFTEIEPDTFVRSDGLDRLVFHRDEANRVTSASLNSRAVFTLERRPWIETPSVTFIAWLATGLVMLLGIVINGVALWRSRGRAQSPVAAAGAWSALLMPLLNLTFIAALVLLIPYLLKGQLPELALWLLLAIPLAAAALSLFLLAVVFLPLWQGKRMLMRAQYAVLAAAGLVFAFTLQTWNLLGWRL